MDKLSKTAKGKPSYFTYDNVTASIEQISSSEEDIAALSPGGRNRSMSRSSRSSRRQNGLDGNNSLEPEDEPFDELPPKSPAITENQDIKDRALEIIYQKKITQLKGSRELVQKNTFTKWINSVLRGTLFKVKDLYRDLRNGRILLTLLEVLSQQKLSRPTKGKMRIHCLENIDKALTFLQEEKQVQLENIGAHDIVDGNPRLTLGLIWTIILRFRIQEVILEEEGAQTKSAKDALLLWCQMKTAEYANVNIRNFTTSWRDGLAFNAIIHKHRPDLIDYAELTAQNPEANLSIAFSLAESLGLDSLMNPEDLEEPDEKSLMTYLVTYYHYFSKLKKGSVSVNRISKVLENQKTTELAIDDYTLRTTELLQWIEKKIKELGDRVFNNSLQGVKNHLQDFNLYRKNEKPPKFSEKGNLEVELFTLQSKMREENRPSYMPDEKLSLAEINKKWEILEKAEHGRELALREELIRQEKMDQLAAKFNKKAGMRETWISDNHRLILQENFGNDLRAVEAAAKKHEAIETDIFAYEERIKNIVAVALELENNNFHAIDTINQRRDNVLRLWEGLITSTRTRRIRLEKAIQLQLQFYEMDYVKDSVHEIRQKLLSNDVGKHLMGVQDQLQKLSLLEADINVMGQSVKIVVENAERFIEEEKDGAFQHCDPEEFDDRLQNLETSFEEIVRLAVVRRSRLEKAKVMWQFYWDMMEEESWVKEMKRILAQEDIGNDLNGVILLTAKFGALETEIHSREILFQESIVIGQNIIQKGLFGSKAVQQKIQEIFSMWENLIQLLRERKRKLAEGVRYHKLMNNIDDADDWITFTSKLIANNIEGLNEFSIELLQKKHEEVEKMVIEYQLTIDSLHAEYASLEIKEPLSLSVEDKLDKIETKYNQLIEISEKRRANLLSTLSFYNLYKEADGIAQWIQEKERMLSTIIPGTDIEDCEIMKHRFDGFDHDIQSNSEKVLALFGVAKVLLDANHFNRNEIGILLHEINSKWSSLMSQIEKKRTELNGAYDLQTFYIECQDTVKWIEEKIKILLETKQLEMDLNGIMTLQRKMYTIIKEKAAIESKINSLKEKGNNYSGDNLNDENGISNIINNLNIVWEKMAVLYKQTEEKLGEAGELHQFLKNLDHFQSWLTKTESDIANQDSPTSVTEAEKVLLIHEQIGEEIESFKDDYTNMMEYGEKVSDEPTTFDDPQYMFLRERLKALKDGWREVGQMWYNKKQFLSQSLSHQLFKRDSKHVEVLLSQQEMLMNKNKTPTNIEQAEDFVKKQEALLATMKVNDEKVNNLLRFADTICEEQHFASAKISNKANNISERRIRNRAEANLQMERLYDQQLLFSFLYDCEQFFIWIHEKNCSVQDDTYRSARTVHGKWTKHQAIQSEITSNRNRLEELKNAGEDLCETKPEMKAPVHTATEDLESAFEKLQQAMEEKEERLFGNKRFNIFYQSCDEICDFAVETKAELLSNPIENLQDLTSVNIMIKKQQIIETKLQVKIQEASRIEDQIGQLVQIDPTKKEELLLKRESVDETFFSVIPNFELRNAELMKMKDIMQFKQDVKDEIIWIEEKRTIALSEFTGNSLQEVYLLLKKNQILKGEISNHETRLHTVVNNGQLLIDNLHPEANVVNDLLEDLQEKWISLKDAVENRNDQLNKSERIHQFFFDLGEAESWISEQDHHIMVTDVSKKEMETQKLISKQKLIEIAIEDYKESIDQLNKTSKQLINEQVDHAEIIKTKMKHVLNLYANLADIIREQRIKLESSLNLLSFKKAVNDLEQWIVSKEIVASNPELGQDYAHVMLLIERFEEFSQTTRNICKVSVRDIKKMADGIIKDGHAEVATILEWKENINNAIDELLELLDTRKQVLAASQELHKYFHDSKDILNRILEKKSSMNDDLGKEGACVSSLQRHHKNFIQNFLPMENEIKTLQESLSFLIAKYAGEKAWEISNLEREVLNAWKELQDAAQLRSQNLAAKGDLYEFLAMIRALMIWMDDLMRQMSTSEKPRDVSEVKLLINSHQLTKAEMDARAENFIEVHTYGKTLLNRNHFASDVIKEKIHDLLRRRNDTESRWEERWEHLQIILEVFEFARDASLAEEWLITQEEYLQSEIVIDSVDQIEQLIKKHVAFEKASLAQEERFLALEKITQFELNDNKRRHQEANEEEERLKQIEKEKDRNEGGLQTAEEDSAVGTGDSRSIESPLSIRTSGLESPLPAPSISFPNSPTELTSLNSPTSLSSPKSPISPTSIQNSDTSTPTTPFFPREQSASYKGSRRSSGESEKKRLSKSPFGSFRFKKSKTIDRQSNISYPRKSVENGQVDGMLMRKYEWESTTKKSSHRSWDRVCVSLRDSQLVFYKDWKTYLTTPEVTYRGERPLQLAGALAKVAQDYTKRNNVFRLRTGKGAEFLFQAESEESMTKWILAINALVDQVNRAVVKRPKLDAGSSRNLNRGSTQTLDAGSSRFLNTGSSRNLNSGSSRRRDGASNSSRRSAYM